VIKSRRIRWKGYKTSMREGRDIYTRFWFVNLTKSDHWENPDVDGQVILKSIFRILDVGHGLD
jgi:hypothetical protein